MIELPDFCFTEHVEDGRVVVIIRGQAGFLEPNPADMGKTARQFNEELGVSLEQERAMVAGSMFGWNTPAARGETHG